MTSASNNSNNPTTSEFVDNHVEDEIKILVCPTTGGQYEIDILPQDTISNLRRKVAREIQIPQERLKLLFKDKVLTEGKICDYNLQEGSKITLLPTMESGFSSTVQGTQQSIIRAIEGLSDTQVDDFLSGRAPLTLALRTGEHMMFVQLQLEQTVDTQPSSVSASFQRPCRCQKAFCEHVTRTEHTLSAKRSSTSGDWHSRPERRSDLSTRNATSSAVQGSSCPASQTLHSSSRSKPTANIAELKHPVPSEQKGSAECKRATTCGRITSGVGSLSHSAASSSGSRFLRQMQRLRRLCVGHQQCAVYSSRELATEISSIVHAAKHSSSVECGSGKRPSSKVMSKDQGRMQGSSRPMRASSRLQSPGASIDSVTTHGPGIFSGTFSGSLHPSIQDEQGRPKRDPQTILQILTDLLSATNKYEGQTGNISMLPQLFKDHLANQTTPSTSANHATSAPTNQQTMRRPSHHSSAKRAHPYCRARRTAYSSHTAAERIFAHPAPNLPCFPLLRPFKEDAPLCPMLMRQVFSSCGCDNLCERKRKKLYSMLQGPKRFENQVTWSKMQGIRQMMEQKRKNRLRRRQATAPYSKPTEAKASASEENRKPRNDTNEKVRKTSLDVQIDEIGGQYPDDRKAEVNVETPETVAV